MHEICCSILYILLVHPFLKIEFGGIILELLSIEMGSVTQLIHTDQVNILD